MARQPTIETLPWWPDAVNRLQELSESEQSRYGATVIAGPEFGVSYADIRNAMERGSVPSYPATSPERAKAWEAGQARFEGDRCEKHNIKTRYTNDGNCIECMAEWEASHGQRQSARRVSP